LGWVRKIDTNHLHDISHNLLDRIGKIANRSDSHQRTSATHREPSNQSD
jgi:hypothetical protein